MFERCKTYLAIILSVQLAVGQAAFASPQIKQDSKTSPTTTDDSIAIDPVIVKVASHPEQPNTRGAVEFEQITVSAHATPEMLEQVAQHIKNKLQAIDQKLDDGYQLEVVSLEAGAADQPIQVQTAQDTTSFSVRSKGSQLDIEADVSEATPLPQTAVQKVLQEATHETSAELKNVKIPLGQKVADFFGTTKRNLYFTIITAVGCGAIAAGLEHQNIVQVIGSEQGISPAWALLTGLGVGGFEGAVQLKIKWYSDWLSDKAFNPYKLTGEKNAGTSGAVNTWIKRFAVCVAFVAMVHSLGAWTGTREAFDASFSYWGHFLYDVLKDSGIYITSTLPLMEYMKATGPKKGFESSKRQLAIMEVVNFAITQGANAAILLGRLPDSYHLKLPEFLQFTGATEIGPSAMISVGMLAAGTVLWLKEVSLTSVWQSLKNKASSLKESIWKGLSACSSIFKS